MAQLDNYKGLYFATFDPEAPPLREYLGEMAWYLDAFFDRREGGIEVIGAHKLGNAVQLEVPRRKLWWRFLSCGMEPSFGDRDSVLSGGVD